MERIVMLLSATLAWSTPVFAQTELTSIPVNSRFLAAAESAQGTAQPARRGFTILVNAGIGVQHDAALEESATGLAGANLGVGAFVNDKLAVLGRFSGTTVNYDFGSFEVGQVSGVVGGTLQFWATNRFIVEAGGGLGFWTADADSETGFGLILGASAVVFSRGKHNLLVGVEYAPAFTDAGTVHNLGITFGYQFHR